MTSTKDLTSHTNSSPEPEIGRNEKQPLQTHYDMVVLGSGPGGHRAAVQAAKLDKRVLVIERGHMGGSCLHLGTIPSKALREAALAFGPTSDSLRSVVARTRRVIDEETLVMEKHYSGNGIEFISGTGYFIDEKTIRIENALGCFQVRGDVIVIAVGTRPRRPAEIDFDNEVIFESDTILDLETQPKSLVVIGAGVIGCEYASIFARMGVKVTLVDSRPDLLRSIDQEIVAALIKQFEKTGISLRLGTEIGEIRKQKNPAGPPVALVELRSAKGVESCAFEAVLYCQGRTGNHETLNLSAIGLQTAVDARGNISVNRNYQTDIPHIYAVGDIIGAPALAASSAEQGRLAALHAWTGQTVEFPDTFPFGIYTIPEISSVGVQEEQLEKRGIKYVVGRANYSELARGKMLDDEFGFLKIIVHAGTRRIVGVHVIGTSATELVHIGQMAIAFGAPIDFLIDNVFNYPTLAEAYKVAAFNAYNQLR